MNNKDDSLVWRTVNWCSEFRTDDDYLVKPSVEEIKVFIESNQNSQGVSSTWNDFTAQVTVPVLDEPVTVLEIECGVGIIRASKVCCPDDLTAGVFKMIPALWLLVLTIIFNSIFSRGIYSASWTRAKIFSIYKKRWQDESEKQ